MMQISKDAKHAILEYIRAAAEDERIGGQTLDIFIKIAEKAINVYMKLNLTYKTTLHKGDFTERGVELYFSDNGDLILRILPKNEDQWEYCAFNKDEAGEFAERFNDMLAGFGG